MSKAVLMPVKGRKAKRLWNEMIDLCNTQNERNIKSDIELNKILKNLSTITPKKDRIK